MEKIQEIKEFWRNEIHEYVDIVTVREIAVTDIYDLVKIIEELQREIENLRGENRMESVNEFINFLGNLKNRIDELEKEVTTLKKQPSAKEIEKAIKKLNGMS